MRSSRTTEVPLKTSAQPFPNHNIGTELTNAWKSLAQSKAALRHIENRLEATPGTGVLLDTFSPKKKTSGTSHTRDGRQADVSRRNTKPRGENHQNPAKSNSRSPLRNATQDSNVRKSSSVEFKEPLASYREATPPSHPFSQSEAYNLQPAPEYSFTSSPPYTDPLPSQLIYQKVTRDKQTDRDLESTHSSAVESAEVRYINDQPVLDSLKTEQSSHKAQLVMDNHESNPCLVRTPGSSRQGESSPSTSPGSVSQRLENLRRHQPDDKLEKLKERIRRQRQHLEETAQGEALKGHLKKPVVAFAEGDSVGSSSMPAAKIRKVTSAPPAPIYKGFNSTETKIQTPDGKVWKEEEFQSLSKEIYGDISQQFSEGIQSRHQQHREQRAERSKERPSKPVRKVHKVPPVSEQNSKPVISPASWREGQKLVKMVLGPPPKLPREEPTSHPAGKQTQAASRHPHQDGTERPRSGFQEKPSSRPTTSYNHSSSAKDRMPQGVNTDVLAVDIQGILDDLQLDCKPAEMEERARKRSRGGSGSRRGRGGSGSRTRAPVSAWGTTVPTSSSRGCRSASPTKRQHDDANKASKGQKKRHYDADTVRQYIAQQQEERKRRQVEEKRAAKEEAERRNQRLAELYKKQREVAKTVTLSTEAAVAPVQKRLQETYTKLLLEDARLGEEQPAHLSAPIIQMRPLYQPSGESDKENKRLEVSQSPSSSDKSLNELPPPPLSRNDLEDSFSLQPDHLNPVYQPTNVATSSVQVSSNEHLLSQILRLDAAMAASSKYSERPAVAPQSHTRMSRIEALKAKATSLSNRIETEARRFAGQEINYGAPTSMDVDTVLPPRNSNVDFEYWTEIPAYATENSDKSFRVHKAATSAGYTTYTDTALPGAENLHDLVEKTYTSLTNPHTVSPGVNGTSLNSYSQERRRRRIVVDLGLKEKENPEDRIKNKREENAVFPYQSDLHDLSSGSISEGPLLSEGSFSEGDSSPPQYYSNRGRNVDYLEAADNRAGKSSNHNRLLEFQRDAAKCAALSPPFSQLNGSKAPWEELNKGSPLSVINIFTKNVQGHVKVNERDSEKSPHGDDQGDAEVYLDDFVSSHSSKASSQLKRGSNSTSHSQSMSPGSTPGSSPLSRHSTSKRATISDQSDATLVEELKGSPLSEANSSDHRRKASDKSLNQAQDKSLDSDTLGGRSAHSPRRRKLVSSSCSPDLSSLTADSPSEHVRRSSNNLKASSRAELRSTGELQYSPAVLRQRMAAEMHYLESIEESIKQLGDAERLMGVSMAQQESASLAQMLKAKQHRHEQELYELKIKTEREALEAKLQLEENRQRVARAHLELQENLAASQKQTLEGLQESASKMVSQQAEAARYTADAARHIKEMAELAQSQITGHLIIPAIATESAVLDHQEEQNSSHTKSHESRGDSYSYKSEVSKRRVRSGEPSSSQNSLSQPDSLSFRRSNVSASPCGSNQTSPSRASSDHREKVKREPVERKRRNERAEERVKEEAACSSIEEDIPAAANDSVYSERILSLEDEKGETTSVATEYSLKFDQSMTEDDIEECSFRSLLPSEAHRRGTMQKKLHHQREAEDFGASLDETLVPDMGSCGSFKSKDAHIAFSSGQDSFSKFTMEMVRQYMKDEEVRLQHQSSLLHLRQKALKEKTRTELAWLEHQKKKLRDKGEDDKMPPIRKKQRGLLLKLQQEQAEIKRLQEANKAARKERQLLLKQQEEIERMRNSTLRLKERLKCAEGEAPPEIPMSEPSGTELSSPRLPDEMRSPSPSLSISGSETSSIMQKLKKMQSHMDEKHCSPVHCFFSVFTAHHWASLSVCLPNLHPKFQLFIYNQLVRFLTRREQQLMQRRHHAEELLQWKQQLDQEEAEVRRMEREALAAWDLRRPLDKDRKTSESDGNDISETGSQASHRQSLELRYDSEKELVSEDNCSSIVTESSIHTEGPVSLHQESPTSVQLASVGETPQAPVYSSPATYTQDFSAESQLPALKSSSIKDSQSPAASPSDCGSKSKMQLRSTSQVPDHLTAVLSENISDQSDIESRIKALREELRKRKIMAYQLKKEQKKRHKERLKAQEAQLLKKLENYNDFIEKTKAELNKEPDSTPDTTSNINDSSYVLEQSSIKPSLHRSDIKSSDSAGTVIDASQNHNTFPQSYHSQSASKALPEDLPNKVPKTPTVTEYSRPSGGHSSGSLLRSLSKPESEDEKVLSDNKSDIEEQLDVEVHSRSEDEQSNLLKPDSQEKITASKQDPPIIGGERERSDGLDQEEQRTDREISEAEDAVKSNTFIPGAQYSAAGNLEASSHVSCSSSAKDPPLTPDSAGSLKKQPLCKDVDVSLGTDGYQEDFESAHFSPSEDHISKHESQVSLSQMEVKHSSKESSRATPTFDTQDEVEEEIPEEISRPASAGEQDLHSEKLVDFQHNGEDLKCENKTEFSSQGVASPLVLDEMPGFQLGDRVLVGGVQPGTLRFKGPTSFANGFWAGVELDKSEGSNNGTYDGVVYFECEESHGIFAPPDKVSHLPDKFELYADTTEDEDSFFDDLSDKGGEQQKKVKGSPQKPKDPEIKNDQTFNKDNKSRDVKDLDEKDQIPLDSKLILNSQHQKKPEHQICHVNLKDVILDLNEASHASLIPDQERTEENEKKAAIAERNNTDIKQDLIPTDRPADIKNDKREEKDGDRLDTFTDKLLNNLIKDCFKQCSEIKRAKEEKIKKANQLNGCLFVGNDEEKWISSVGQKDNLPFFLPAEKGELSSPELCNRSESPVFGPSGQEELAKRLAELELSRELLDDIGDDQDWFDEDFGLSSRRQQQRLKQKEELGGELGRSLGPHMGAMVSSLGGDSQVKTPPRPELPLPLPPKLPEQPAMIVPHSATEVEKMVHSATQEIWEAFGLGKEGALILEQLSKPTPSLEYLGKESSSQDQDALSIISYKKAVFDLTWELLKEIFAEDPNTDQPQWVKPRQVKSSFIHRVKTAGDINKIQEFVTEEVLKLYGLKQDQSQKTDWQKMLKFGRKKRDRVDHILAQELHEEEAQWVNYDEDELCVKLQLADSIFQTLLKDTANTFTLISDKRAKRGALS
ncbi:PREDICTED: centrosome-associated protein 350 isoform X1 [Cyprinodon variegatus]|uniref:centrosome-associated protein 350 isoform X1 n=1 Tax=Cyprinodon variegatus TaxID=28743 RepID=UPI0007425F67|nr:PREDICTED: centrosome-associated protein 350 isoform X1 [Cyprinodon variegatus]